MIIWHHINLKQLIFFFCKLKKKNRNIFGIIALSAWGKNRGGKKIDEWREEIEKQMSELLCRSHQEMIFRVNQSVLFFQKMPIFQNIFKKLSFYERLKPIGTYNPNLKSLHQWNPTFVARQK